ncbi:MAG: mechanosensitive ion channel, partial [Elusimicrobiaceae bacterium]|nr:mechanosensitive ion channel [Elusimicrobiaceae bacterium]
LSSKSYIDKTATKMVRQLAPTSEGLPLQMYAFLNTTEWVKYESLQGDIFDHLLSVLPEFGLKVFQKPSGKDFARIINK